MGMSSSVMAYANSLYCEGVPNGFALGTALHHSQFCISKEDVRFRMKR